MQVLALPDRPILCKITKAKARQARDYFFRSVLNSEKTFPSSRQKLSFFKLEKVNEKEMN
jgi:hypothetical protein